MAAFEEDYAKALEEFLRRPGEAGLDGAQGLGRRALRENLGVLEITVLHEKVLSRAGYPRELVGEVPEEADHPALDFLLQVLAVLDAPRSSLELAREQLAHRHQQVAQLQALTEASFKMLSTFDPDARLALVEEAAAESLAGVSVASAVGGEAEADLIRKLPPAARAAFRGFKAGENLVRASSAGGAGLVHLMAARAPSAIGPGPLIAAWRDGECFSDLDVALFVQLSQLTSVAITNAQLFERERETAVVLQRSLLPIVPSGLAGIELATCYIPARPGASVGGDWFDAFELPSGRLGLVIGDVMGHDIVSAAVMGQYRIAVRAYALEGHSPSSALNQMDRLCSSFVGDRYATVLFATLESSGDFCLSNAGHPPPIVIDVGGQASLLEGGVSVPACMGLPDFQHAELRATLSVGTTLFFYTDGLIERRGSQIGDRFAELLAALSGPPRPLGEPLKALCEEAVAHLAGTEPEDDVCVMAVRLSGVGPPG